MNLGGERLGRVVAVRVREGSGSFLKKRTKKLLLMKVVGLVAYAVRKSDMAKRIVA
jgi:hypothetical protein